MRPQVSLSGTWQFQVDPEGTLNVASIQPDREIIVPLPWQAAFPELASYSGYAWYRRTFEVERSWLEGEILLEIGAVDYWCQVFVNGKLAGEHEGGYTPVRLPVRALVQEGDNEVAVRVYDSAQGSITVPRWRSYDGKANEARQGGPPFDAEDIPHGKQEWYLNVGGIWQDVTLTVVPRTYIDYVHVTPDIHSGEAHIMVEVAGEAAERGSLRVEITNDQGPLESKIEAVSSLASGKTTYSLTAKVDTPHLWDLGDPYLYTATVSLATEEGSAGQDSVSVHFGFREIATREGRILLNGRPIYLLSALDQDLYPDTIYTVPSEEYLRDQFRKALDLGLNNLRCHIKPPDPRYLDLADEMGLLVWAEIPSWRTFYVKGTQHREQLDLPDEIKRRVERTLEEMVRRDFNHPSLVIWTIVNEDWGTTLPLSAADREWVSEMYDRCKQLDPTRLVVDNSACPHPWGPNIHVRSDLDDFHIYTNIPDQARAWMNSIEQFNLRPVWTYSSKGDAQRTGEEPLVLSEFGNWGLPSLKRLRQSYGGEDPPWFRLGPWWNSWEGEAGWPAGVDERFKRLGLDRIWEDYEQFVAATQWHQFSAFKYEIETMRRQQHLQGYVITEFTDAYWESNGLLDFYRNPKVYNDVFSQINAPDVIVPQLPAYSYCDDEDLRARLFLSRYSTRDWSGARLLSSLGESAEVEHELPAVEHGSVQPLGVHSWRLEEVARSTMVPLALVVRGEAGEIARNVTDILVMPTAARTTDYKEPIAVISRDLLKRGATPPVAARPPEGMDWAHPDDVGQTESLSEEALDPTELIVTLQRLGYTTSGRITVDTKLAVTNFPNAALLKWVREGGSLLFLNSGPSPFFWAAGRGGTYSGNWLTSFSWIRPEVHRRLPVHNPLSMPYMRIMPKYTILGLPVEDKAVQGDFLAGMVSGWVGHPSVHTVQFRYGRGRVIMTTFTLEEPLRDDPTASAMFHDLIDYLASDACDPTLRANW